jgi:hypothetical protein
MERKRGRRNPELLADCPCRKARRARPDQPAKDREARLLREGGEGLHGLLRFHISRIMEMKQAGCQAVFAGSRIKASTVKAATPSAPVKNSAPVPNRDSRMSKTKGEVAEKKRAGAISKPCRSP